MNSNDTYLAYLAALVLAATGGVAEHEQPSSPDAAVAEALGTADGLQIRAVAGQTGAPEPSKTVRSKADVEREVETRLGR